MSFIYHNEDVNFDYFTDTNAIGGSGGAPFTFIKLDEGASLMRIKSWRKPRAIRGVEVWMTDGSSFLAGHRDGELDEFGFESGERITWLSIKPSLQARWKHDGGWDVSMDHRLGAIEFGTDHNRRWGISSGYILNDGEYQPLVGSGICCGIFGAAWDDVDRLGFVMLRTMKQAILTNVTYPNLALQMVATKPATVAQESFSNGTDLAQTFILKGSKTVTVTREWSNSATMSLSLAVTVKAEIPLVASVEGKTEWSLSATDAYSNSETTSETKSWDWPIACPPRRRILAEATMYEDAISTEYEADLELHLDNGKVYRRKEKNTYNGIQARDVIVSVKDIGPYDGN